MQAGRSSSRPVEIGEGGGGTAGSRLKKRMPRSRLCANRGSDCFCDLLVHEAHCGRPVPPQKKPLIVAAVAEVDCGLLFFTRKYTRPL